MASFFMQQFLEIIVAYRLFSFDVSLVCFQNYSSFVSYLGSQGQFWGNSGTSFI